jgi:hypothetical protein
MLLRRIAGVSALLAVRIGSLSGVLFLAAGRFRPYALLDPVRLLEGRSVAAGALTAILFAAYTVWLALLLLRQAPL